MPGQGVISTAKCAAIALALTLLLALLFLACPAPVIAECRPEPITPNTPTGIAGCEVWGEGIASHYGPGNGVAMNFCTWELRHATGCGEVIVTSLDTGRVVRAPVVDFGDLYTGTPDQRIADLQYGVVEALGLDLAAGLYEVTVWPVQDVPSQSRGNGSGDTLTVPDTAGIGPEPARGTDTAVSDCRLELSVPTDTSLSGWFIRFLLGWLSTICVAIGIV